MPTMAICVAAAAASLMRSVSRSSASIRVSCVGDDRREIVAPFLELIALVHARERRGLVRRAIPIEHGDLLGTEARMPEVHEQDDTNLVAVIPHLVLERVIEDQQLPLLPCADLIAYLDVAALRHFQPEMRPDDSVDRSH